MPLIVGFLILGLFIGDLVGMTSESVVSRIVALLFAIFGGSVLVFLQKLQVSDRRIAGWMIGALAGGGLLGVNLGIYTVQHRLLSARQFENATTNITAPLQQSPPVEPMPIRHAEEDKPQLVKDSGAKRVFPGANPCEEPSPYLRASRLTTVAAIDQKLDARIITESEAYKQLREYVTGGQL